METIVLERDIKIFYIEASSFPEGVLPAHEKLHAMVPFSAGRAYFGVSRPEGDVIVYKAGTEETYAGEAEQYGCKTMIIKKGKYIAKTVMDFAKDVTSIERAFQKLLKHPGLDPQGYCVECYLSEKDVRCMVRLE